MRIAKKGRRYSGNPSILPFLLRRDDAQFMRQLVEHFLRIAVDDQPDGILGRKPSLIAIKELILPDLRRGRLVLDDGRAVAHLDIGKRVRPAPVADKQRVALRVVARPLGLGRYLDQSPVAVLADAGRKYPC